MSIGTKNRLIRIYRRTDAVNEANEPLPDAWELFKTKWADVRGETGLSTIRSSASAGGVNTPMNRYSMAVPKSASFFVCDS